MLLVLELAPELIAVRGGGDAAPICASIQLRQPPLEPFRVVDASEPMRCDPAVPSAMATPPARRPHSSPGRTRPRRRLLRLAPLTAAAAIVGTAVMTSNHENPATQPAVADESPSLAQSSPPSPPASFTADTPRFIPIDSPTTTGATTAGAHSDPASAPRSIVAVHRPTRRQTGPIAIGVGALDTDRPDVRAIPARLLAAYRTAATNADQAHPACGLTWQQLAAVGFVASDHGRRGTVAGRPGVYGTVLDGREGVLYVDSDDGVLDGDKRYDRSVGVMGILPRAWSLLAVDGDHDGRTDPQDVDDAAATAATVLCSAGTSLATPSGFRSALHTYDATAAFEERAERVARIYAGLPAAATRTRVKGTHRKPPSRHRAAQTSGTSATTP